MDAPVFGYAVLILYARVTRPFYFSGGHHIKGSATPDYGCETAAWKPVSLQGGWHSTTVCTPSCDRSQNKSQQSSHTISLSRSSKISAIKRTIVKYMRCCHKLFGQNNYFGQSQLGVQTVVECHPLALGSFRSSKIFICECQFS